MFLNERLGNINVVLVGEISDDFSYPGLNMVISVNCGSRLSLVLEGP